VEEYQEADGHHDETDRRGRGPKQERTDSEIDSGEADSTEGVEETRHRASTYTRDPPKDGFRSNRD
jgi:hypothetical protein